MKQWILASTIFISLFFSCLDCRESYIRNVKPILIEGVIQRKFYQENHAVPTLELLREEKLVHLSLLHNDIYKIWEMGEIGDSIAKDSGSLEYKLFTSDTILYFYPECVFPSEMGKLENPHFDSNKLGEWGFSVFKR